MPVESFNDVEEFNKEFEKVKKRLIKIRDEDFKISESEIRSFERNSPYYVLVFPIIQAVFLVFSYLFFQSPVEIINIILSAVGIIITTIALLYFQQRLFHPLFLGRLCFHLSVTAAEKLENNELVEASFLVTRLVKYLDLFSKKQRIKLGGFKSDLKTLFLGRVEKLVERSSAVGNAVLENEFAKDSFVRHLYELAEAIRPAVSEEPWEEKLVERSSAVGNAVLENESAKDSFIRNLHELIAAIRSVVSEMRKPENPPVHYDKAIRSIDFFSKASMNYLQKEKTFLERHKELNKFLRILSEVGKLVIVPLLGFVLWLLFGYK